MYDVLHETTKNDFPKFLGKIFAFLANPGLIIPAILLMFLDSPEVDPKTGPNLREVEKNHKSIKGRAIITNSEDTLKNSSKNYHPAKTH
ncbi:Transmembrane channel-like protein 2 [Lemmus lemmus]